MTAAAQIKEEKTRFEQHAKKELAAEQDRVKELSKQLSDLSKSQEQNRLVMEKNAAAGMQHNKKMVIMA